MPTYEYQYTDNEDNETVEVEQSIKEEALTILNGRPVKRLISAPVPFHLRGDCWARTNYERGLQSGPKDK
jgi:predicted nucleic acid-binding Zn ribbon protein